ncbi:MAG: DGQHR domain-containing protein [Ignavibacteriaceae bacterium]|nr:DGQHR domain-containing protein [Ignavibacteriaceae bacterium]
MKVKDVISVHYVAVRGKDSEDGAVQRVLNSQRVKQIKEFVLRGNSFFNTFILNWSNENDSPSFNNQQIHLPIVKSSAQIIDGQHRLAGLNEAMKEDSCIGEKEIVVALCIKLSMKDAASIFVNINSEQKPVPKSLIYDLFGEFELDKDHYINRAHDIATELNENVDSPYYRSIRFPGSTRGVGSVDLSTIVNSLKKAVSKGGELEKVGIIELQMQKVVILNFFKAIKSCYDEENLWEKTTRNPFLSNAGFVGAIDFFTQKLLAKCVDKKTFKVEDIKAIINLPKGNLLEKKALKDKDGKTQRKEIFNHLEYYMLNKIGSVNEFQF